MGFMEHHTIREIVKDKKNIDGADLFFDWFCSTKALDIKGKKLLGNVRAISKSPKLNIDELYVLFKNNCPCCGGLYDDFRLVDMKSEDVIWCVVPPHHDGYNGEVWTRNDKFEMYQVVADASWRDIKQFFMVA